MSAAQEPLLASTFWGIRRPVFPLTAGHFVIQLIDPAAAFEHGSAADLLHCYGHLRRALTALMGATSAQLYSTFNGHPDGDAIGEPDAETPTPTLHIFITWPGSTPASHALRLPSHQRVAAAYTGELDDALRNWGGGIVTHGGAAPCGFDGGTAIAAGTDSLGTTGLHGPGEQHPRPGDPAPGADRSWEPEGWADRPFHIEPARPVHGEPFRCGHWTAVPRFAVAPLDCAEPEALLDLVKTMKGLASHSLPPFHGTTVWATDQWGSAKPRTLHIFAREHGDVPPLVADFVARGGLDWPSSG